jgi:hypothetical protein
MVHLLLVSFLFHGSYVKAMLSLNVIHVFYFEILPIHLRILAMDEKKR